MQRPRPCLRHTVSATAAVFINPESAVQETLLDLPELSHTQVTPRSDFEKGDVELQK